MKRAIRRADVALAEDFVILQEGVKPSIGGRAFMLVFSLVLFGGGVYFLLKKEPLPARPPQSPPPGQTPGQTPPAQPPLSQ